MHVLGNENFTLTGFLAWRVPTKTKNSEVLKTEGKKSGKRKGSPNKLRPLSPGECEKPYEISIERGLFIPL